MDTQRSGRARLPVDFGQKAVALVASGGNGAGLKTEIEQFGMFMGPAARADLIPQRRFYRFDDAHRGAGWDGLSSLVDRAEQDITDLDGAVVAGAQQVQRGDSGN